MLGDQTMEKKINGRSPSVNPKGSGTEASSKGKQDVGKYPRLPRSKESPSPRSEPTRKPISQRNRNVCDKRPRTRASNILDKYRSEIAEAGPPDDGKGVKRGSKKVNLNHLLNFTLAPHESASFSGRPGRQKFPKYNKEQFLQANCQFIVQDTGNYTIHAADPDVLVDWSLVEEIHLSNYEDTVCPICLYPLVAAKITRCGHLYCWSCILHYLSLTDKSWRKCPICFEAVHKEDLKSVVPTTKPAYQVGDELTMCLMKRERRSLFSLPASRKNSVLKPFYVNEDSTTERFQKLLLATTHQIHDIIKRERSELKAQLLIEGDKPEVCFIESALELLDKREQKLLEYHVVKEGKDTKLKPADICEDNIVPKLKSPNFPEPVFDYWENIPTSPGVETCAPLDYQSGADEEINKKSEDICQLTCEQSREMLPEDLHLTDLHIQEPDKHDKGKYCYFYQASDGQHIYLHTLNVHMLVKEYGSLEHCPSTFTAKIVELHGISMTEGLRKRLRYLQHLPLTCEFQIAELQLIPPIISESTVESFAAEVDKRRHLRIKKAREEKRRERFMKIEENKKLGRYPRATFSLDSLQHFPSYNPADDPPLVATLLEVPQDSKENVLDTTCQEQSVWPTNANPGSQSTFAQMLRDGRAKCSDTTPPIKNGEVSSPEPISGNDIKVTHESDGEDYIPAPEFHQSFSDAIQAAFDNLSTPSEAAGKQELSKKRKKKPKTLLFTTSMNRSK